MALRRGAPNSARDARIWDKPNIKAMLRQRPGSPVSLTRAEAKAIARAAFGKRPDLPAGKRYVRQIRPLWRDLLKTPQKHSFETH